jgi:hypothetical protein
MGTYLIWRSKHSSPLGVLHTRCAAFFSGDDVFGCPQDRHIIVGDDPGKIVLSGKQVRVVGKNNFEILPNVGFVFDGTSGAVLQRNYCCRYNQATTSLLEARRFLC